VDLTVQDEKEHQPNDKESCYQQQSVRTGKSRHRDSSATTGPHPQCQNRNKSSERGREKTVSLSVCCRYAFRIVSRRSRGRLLLDSRARLDATRSGKRIGAFDPRARIEVSLSGSAFRRNPRSGGAATLRITGVCVINTIRSGYSFVLCPNS
jgi:hypothetical protein